MAFGPGSVTEGGGVGRPGYDVAMINVSPARTTSGHCDHAVSIADSRPPLSHSNSQTKIQWWSTAAGGRAKVKRSVTATTGERAQQC